MTTAFAVLILGPVATLAAAAMIYILGFVATCYFATAFAIGERLTHRREPAVGLTGSVGSVEPMQEAHRRAA